MKFFNNIRKKLNDLNYILLFICILFYLLFPLLDGPVWCVDSNGYAIMHITREPLYPTFLALCRWIARPLDVDYLMIAAVIQSLLAGIVTWYLGYTVYRMLNRSRLLQIGAILFQFAVTLLCRFAAHRGSAYTESIMTEGIGLPLFTLFCLQLFLFIRTRQQKHLWWMFAISFLLIDLRKQLMITLLIMMIVFAWYVLFRERNIRQFLFLFAMTCCVLIADKVTDRTYQYLVRGVWMEHSGNSMGLLCTLLYSSDLEKDQALFTDETLRELYLEIMEQADAEHILHSYAPAGWLSAATHYADSYDAIGYGIVNPVLESYLSTDPGISETEAAMRYDEICNEMNRVLSRQNPVSLLQVYAYNTWSGFVNSIARSTHLLSLYAVAAYASVAAMSRYLILLKRRLVRMTAQYAMSDTEQSGTQDHTPKARGQYTPYTALTAPMIRNCQRLILLIDRSLCFTLIVIVSIVVNALVVGAVIFTQPRYMIYSMGLFYAVVCILLYDIIDVHHLIPSKD